MITRNRHAKDISYNGLSEIVGHDDNGRHAICAFLRFFSKIYNSFSFLIIFFYSELIQRPCYAEILKIGTTNLQMKTTPISFQLTSLQSCLGNPRTRCLMDVRSRISINFAFDIKLILITFSVFRIVY
jgi:hypothetical protein